MLTTRGHGNIGHKFTTVKKGSYLAKRKSDEVSSSAQEMPVLTILATGLF